MDENYALLQHFDLKRMMEDMERFHIYFRGHAETFAYLKKIGVIWRKLRERGWAEKKLAPLLRFPALSGRDIRKLVGFKFKRHPAINWPEERLIAVERHMQKHVRQILGLERQKSVLKRQKNVQIWRGINRNKRIKHHDGVGLTSAAF
ncbi:MAG: hypothetical protein LBJ64_09180 [Deltaproteobacteria bacterium]|jgi:hypothetical protein|nr:hypothetical protein [Deltaproteobacteria bacterium]